MLDGPALHLDDRLTAGVRLVLGVAVVERAAHHRADDAVLVDMARLDRVGLDRAAVSDHGDRIGDGGDLVELVGDHDRRDPAALETLHQQEQVLRVVLVQRGRGLIQDQQLDVLRQRFRDLDQLLLAHAQVLHRHVRVDVEAHASEQVAAAAPSLAPVDETTGDDLVAEEDVLGDGELGDEGELLVDDDDAGALRGLDVLERHLLALEHDLPAVGAVGVHAGQHLHERRLPGAVLPADRVDVAAADGHRDVVERADPREQLGDVPHLENCVRIDHLYLRPLIECHRAVALPSR